MKTNIRIFMLGQNCKYIKVPCKKKFHKLLLILKSKTVEGGWVAQ